MREIKRVLKRFLIAWSVLNSVCGSTLPSTALLQCIREPFKQPFSLLVHLSSFFLGVTSLILKERRRLTPSQLIEHHGLYLGLWSGGLLSRLARILLGIACSECLRGHSSGGCASSAKQNRLQIERDTYFSFFCPMLQRM